MKYKKGHYFSVSRKPFSNEGHPAPVNCLRLPTRWLWIWLHEIEHKFTHGRRKGEEGDAKDWFFRTNRDLAKDTGLSERAINIGKKELEEAGYIQTRQAHWRDRRTGKMSEKHVTGFLLLK